MQEFITAINSIMEPEYAQECFTNIKAIRKLEKTGNAVYLLVMEDDNEEEEYQVVLFFVHKGGNSDFAGSPLFEGNLEKCMDYFDNFRKYTS